VRRLINSRFSDLFLEKTLILTLSRLFTVTQEFSPEIIRSFGPTWRRTARRIRRLKDSVLTISPDYSDRPTPRLFGALGAPAADKDPTGLTEQQMQWTLRVRTVATDADQRLEQRTRGCVPPLLSAVSCSSCVTPDFLTHSFYTLLRRVMTAPRGARKEHKKSPRSEIFSQEL
jgi:hypothetical protein